MKKHRSRRRLADYCALTISTLVLAAAGFMIMGCTPVDLILGAFAARIGNYQVEDPRDRADDGGISLSPDREYSTTVTLDSDAYLTKGTKAPITWATPSGDWFFAVQLSANRFKITRNHFTTRNSGVIEFVGSYKDQVEHPGEVKKVSAMIPVSWPAP